MKKQLFWIGIAGTIIGVVSTCLYVTLTSLNVFPFELFDFLPILCYIVCAWLPYLAHIIFKVKIDFGIAISYLVFITLSIVIGSGFSLYDYWPAYDAIIHFGSAILIALIGYMFFTNTKQKVNKAWLFLICLTFTVCCGAVWEIIEYAIDGAFGTNMQIFAGFSERGALVDTMEDLICDFTGGLIGSCIALVMEKRKSANKEQDATYTPTQVLTYTTTENMPINCQEEDCKNEEVLNEKDN